MPRRRISGRNWRSLCAGTHIPHRMDNMSFPMIRPRGGRFEEPTNALGALNAPAPSDRVSIDQLVADLLEVPFVVVMDQVHVDHHQEAALAERDETVATRLHHALEAQAELEVAVADQDVQWVDVGHENRPIRDPAATCGVRYTQSSAAVLVRWAGRGSEEHLPHSSPGASFIRCVTRRTS